MAREPYLIAALLLTAAPALGQTGAVQPQAQPQAVGQPTVQGQIMYACPPGYVCTPSPQPPAMQPRQPTPEELQRIQSVVVQQTTGAMLTPANIGQLRDHGLDAQSAATTNGYSGDDPPQPEPRTIAISDPSKRVPDNIVLALGVVTPITFLDKAGKPWPITRIDTDTRTFMVDGVGCGSAAGGAAAQSGEAQPTTISVMPCRYKTFGNLLVRLEGLPTPIVLFARSGDSNRTVDLPVTIRITGPSPATAAKQRESEVDRRAAEMRRAYTAGAATPKGVDPELDSFLTAVPPKGAEPLRTDMPGLSAWQYGDRLYIRGPVSVLTPAYDAMGSSTSGQFVYRFLGRPARIRVTLEDGAERAVQLGL